jgi:hypothetical protein
MDENTFQERLAKLVKEIDSLPTEKQGQLRNLADEARERQARMKDLVQNLTESLDYLRLSVKYLVFDLEATRRENKYLRDMLERKDGNESG